MDVDGFTAHTFAALTHGLDLNEIVVVGGEAELRSGFVGQDSADVVVAVSLKQHLRRERATQRNEPMQKLSSLIVEINQGFAGNRDLPNIQWPLTPSPQQRQDPSAAWGWSLSWSTGCWVEPDLELDKEPQVKTLHMRWCMYIEECSIRVQKGIAVVQLLRTEAPLGPTLILSVWIIDGGCSGAPLTNEDRMNSEVALRAPHIATQEKKNTQMDEIKRTCVQHSHFLHLNPFSLFAYWVFLLLALLCVQGHLGLGGKAFSHITIFSGYCDICLSLLISPQIHIC